MPIERQEGRTPRRPPNEVRRERRAQQGTQLAAGKSRYKLYDRPQRSTFASALDYIKRERDPTLPSTSTTRTGPKRTVQISLDGERVKEPTSSRAAPLSRPRPSIVREDSSVNITKRKSQYFKDVFSEYLKKRALTVGPTPRRIRIIKVYVPRNLDEALVESIKRFKPLKKFDNSWREPRLQWLEKLELESNVVAPKTLPDDPPERDNGHISDCFLCLYPYCRRRKTS